MIESYTKEGRGRSVQFARGTFSALEMTERGLATIDDDGTFTALPLEGGSERFDGGHSRFESARLEGLIAEQLREQIVDVTVQCAQLPERSPWG